MAQAIAAQPAATISRRWGSTLLIGEFMPAMLHAAVTTAIVLGPTPSCG
jgi:hypothetical protein